jgi:xanthine dehydrogenase iron-sulfur cluster and FAD-binding subunit A
MKLTAEAGNGGRRRQMSSAIRFILNTEELSLGDFGPTETLLDYLRLRRRLTGTKEGCAEGDCGACTVLVGRLSERGLIYESVNACIRLLGSLHGTHIVTVEHWPQRMAFCIRCSRRWSTVMARNAASARRAS